MHIRNLRKIILSFITILLIGGGVASALGILKPIEALQQHQHDHSTQTNEHDHHQVETQSPELDRAALNVLNNENMHVAHSGDHLNATKLQTEAEGDNERANQILEALAKNLEKYKDINVAKTEGYQTNTTVTKALGKIYHYNSPHTKNNGLKLDPINPNSLLYQRSSNGSYNFIGVMYVAKAKLTLEELNKDFFPLSKSIWHKHLNICRFDDGRKTSHNLTEEACTAQGGTYKPESSWMTHLLLYKPVAQMDPMTPHEHSE